MTNWRGPHTSGHWYFALSDPRPGKKAVVDAKAWRSTAARIGFVPEPGDVVIVSGMWDFYAPTGRASLIVDRMKRADGGDSLPLRLAQLRDHLQKEAILIYLSLHSNLWEPIKVKEFQRLFSHHLRALNVADFLKRKSLRIIFFLLF